MNIKVKIVCVYVTRYIHSHKNLFPYISLAIIIMFAEASLIPEWKQGCKDRENFSFDTKPSPNISDLTRARQVFPLPDS